MASLLLSIHLVHSSAHEPDGQLFLRMEKATGEVQIAQPKNRQNENNTYHRLCISHDELGRP